MSEAVGTGTLDSIHALNFDSGQIFYACMDEMVHFMESNSQFIGPIMAQVLNHTVAIVRNEASFNPYATAFQFLHHLDHPRTMPTTHKINKAESNIPVTKRKVVKQRQGRSLVNNISEDNDRKYYKIKRESSVIFGRRWWTPVWWICNEFWQ